MNGIFTIWSDNIFHLFVKRKGACAQAARAPSLLITTQGPASGQRRPYQNITKENPPRAPSYTRGIPVIHRNPSIMPFQGHVSGMGSRHPARPPPHSHWTTGRKLPVQTRLTFPPVDKAETWSAHFRKLFLPRPLHPGSPIRHVICRFPSSANLSYAASIIMVGDVQFFWKTENAHTGIQGARPVREPHESLSALPYPLIGCSRDHPRAITTHGRRRIAAFLPLREHRPFLPCGS